MNIPSRWLDAGGPVLAIACASLPLFGRFGLAEVVAVTGVAAVSAWSAVRAWRAAAARCEEHEPVGVESDGVSLARPGDGLPPLLQGILPVWRDHVESVRSQTDTAVGELVVSFSSITEQFEAAGFKGTSGSSAAGQDTTISLLTLCERELQPVIASMTRITDSKGALVASVHELSVITGELQTMASGVTNVAAQTNLLAINAAIEAARAGVAGRGFAVIAKEIRSLSQASAKTAQHITGRMAQIVTIMKSTSEAAARAEESDKSAIELSGTVVEDVLSHVRALSLESQTMLGKGNLIRSNIEDLIVTLQFQDRVSQVIGVVDQDMARLCGTLEADASLPSADEWLADLQRHYTMKEQRRSHVVIASGNESSAGTVPAAAVFF